MPSSAASLRVTTVLFVAGRIQRRCMEGNLEFLRPNMENLIEPAPMLSGGIRAEVENDLSVY